ncbi:hypothetical protein [Janthinobacterium sp. B9-8]|uniref:hypothetical protein n=1 Tax=Janthinobacterium sp. B9-8 TaxID=1236179 RepID=UPI00061CDD0D|nr:hypothetical protein [Janthinobacterium sp. B9-8]AMC36048.1 hypothetical protein VN23_16305 [Janthinobacterium sp. B9-8]
MNKLNLTALSVALFLGVNTSAIGDEMSKPDYKAAKEGISAMYKSDQSTCKTMTDNAKDVCSEEAKGREKVAKAELEVKNSPSVKHRYDLRMAKADAAYDVAKEKCDDASGNAKDVCRKEAKGAYVTAKADAKVAEKTSDANTTAREKSTEVRKDAVTDKQDAAYATAKEKCDALAGDTKANCLKEAKKINGQP